jgi:hypothetical protein
MVRRRIERGESDARTNELAMQAVRWGLAYHVTRWHHLHLMHGDEAHREALPEEVPEDLLALLKDALGAAARPCTHHDT